MFLSVRLPWPVRLHSAMADIVLPVQRAFADLVRRPSTRPPAPHPEFVLAGHAIDRNMDPAEAEGWPETRPASYP